MNTEDPFLRALTGTEAEETITIARAYRASPGELWSALTTPERIARWYGRITGPTPAVGESFEVDLGGGLVRRAVLETCEAPTELSYTWWSGDEDPGLVRIRLQPTGDVETRLTVQHDRLRPHRMIQYGGGWEQNLVALATLVGADAGPALAADVRARRWELLRARPLRLEATIDAPVGDVWRAWSSAAGLASWWWTHWDDVAITADVRVGGSYRVDAPDHGIALSGEYLVVDPDRRLAFTWRWTDAGGTSRDEAVDVLFEAKRGGTAVTVRHTGPWDTDAPADSYRQGWDFVLAELGRRLS